MCYTELTMESINKNMPLISCIIGLGILILSILHFIGGVRTELKADMAEVKTELKADIAEVRGEVREVRSELKEEMANLETRLNTRMERMETRLNAKLDQLLQAQRKPASSKITKKPKKASS